MGSRQLSQDGHSRSCPAPGLPYVETPNAERLFLMMSPQHLSETVTDCPVWKALELLLMKERSECGFFKPRTGLDTLASVTPQQ